MASQMEPFLVFRLDFLTKIFSCKYGCDSIESQIPYTTLYGNAMGLVLAVCASCVLSVYIYDRNMLYQNLHTTLTSNSKVLKLNVNLIGGKTDFPWDTYVVFVWDHIS